LAKSNPQGGLQALFLQRVTGRQGAAELAGGSRPQSDKDREGTQFTARRLQSPEKQPPVALLFQILAILSW
jgi:hypothetical protein